MSTYCKCCQSHRSRTSQLLRGIKLHPLLLYVVKFNNKQFTFVFLFLIFSVLCFFLNLDTTNPINLQTAKSKAGSGNKSSNLVSSASNTQSKSGYAAGTVSSTSQSVPVRSSSTVKVTGSFSASAPRASAPPRLIASSAGTISTTFPLFLLSSKPTTKF